MTPAEHSGRLALGMLSVFGLPPIEFVDLAARLGCRHISVAIQGMPLVPLGYPPFSLKDDAAFRKDLLAAMDDRGVRISLGDGFLVRPGADVNALGSDLDVMAELGVPRINVVSLEPDLPRTFDQFAALTELAARRNIVTVVEPVPGLTIGDLATAMQAVDYVGREDFRLLIDTMHLVRSGSGQPSWRPSTPITSATPNSTTRRCGRASTITWRRPCSSAWRPVTANCRCGKSFPRFPLTLSSKSKFPNGHWRCRG